jgi:hypothetical protein
VLTSAFGIAAGEPKCDSRLNQEADVSIRTLTNMLSASRAKIWAEALRSFKSYGACDDGYIAEGYSDTISRGPRVRLTKASIKADRSSRAPARGGTLERRSGKSISEFDPLGLAIDRGVAS